MDNPFSDVPFMVWFDLDVLYWNGRVYWWLEPGFVPGDMKKAFNMIFHSLNRDNV